MKLFNFPASEMSPPIGSIFWFAGVIEVVGGVLVLLGLFTRPAAFVLAGEMAVAYFMAHAPQGFFPVMNGGDAAVLFCFVFLYLVFAGPGAWSLDARRATAPEPRAAAWPPRLDSRRASALNTARTLEEDCDDPAFDATRARAAGAELGALPEWDLCDLYAAPDAPELARDTRLAGRRVRGLRRRLRGQARRGWTRRGSCRRSAAGSASRASPAGS